MELFGHNGNGQTDGLTELFLKSLSRLKTLTLDFTPEMRNRLSMMNIEQVEMRTSWMMNEIVETGTGLEML